MMKKNNEVDEIDEIENVITMQGVQHLCIDDSIQRRVLRKLDWNLMPLVVGLYLCAILDRGNIGNANTANMSKDLDMSDPQYQWLLTIFYIPYITFEWLALMWKVVPPHYWAFCTVLTWGVASTLQAAAYSWSALMACRFFMAVAEAGYGPGLPYLLSFFYMRGEIGKRIGVFLSASPLANCFAGALAYGITSGRPAFASWRVLFLTEGLPTIALAFVALFCMPDSPEKARFLTVEEKEVARARAVRQTGQEGEKRVGGINFREVGEAFLDIKNWLTAFMYFSVNVSFSSLPVFLPTILTGMGFSSITAQGLTAPPYFLSFLVCILSTQIADRTSQRGITIIVLSIIGGVGYTLLATVEGTAVRYFAVFLVAGGVFPCIANILPWVLNNQGSDTKRGSGIAILNIIGQCGPILGTRLYPASEGLYYVKGMAVCAAFMFFNALLALCLRTYLVWENKRADLREAVQIGGGHWEGGNCKEEHKGVATENEGFGFRNIL